MKGTQTTSNPINSSNGKNDTDIELGSTSRPNHTQNSSSNHSIESGESGKSNKSSSSKVPHIHIMVAAIKPESEVALEGKWAWGFVIWYVVTCSVMIGVLCWFFLVGSCVLNSTVVDTTIGELTHQSHSKQPVFATAYNSNMNLGTYICSSYVYTSNTVNNTIIPCFLPGLSCSDYAHSKSILSQCDALVSFDCSYSDDYFTYPGTNDVFPTCGDASTTVGAAYATVTYLQCTNLPTTIVNSVQYTLYAYLGIYLIYMVVFTLCTKGANALIYRDTWLSFFNLQTVKEE